MRYCGRGLLLAVVPIALLTSACDSNSTTAANNIAENEGEADENGLEAAVDPLIEISWSRLGSGARLTIANEESGTIHLQRVVVNGQESDPSCRVNLFRDLGPGQEMSVEVPGCGDITAVEVFTDRGVRRSSWGSFERSIETSTNNTPGLRTTTIRNVGTQKWTVNRLVLNEQSDDPQCVVRVFQDVEPHSSIVVNTDSCGQINQIEVQTSAGNALFSVTEYYDPTSNAM